MKSLLVAALTLYSCASFATLNYSFEYEMPVTLQQGPPEWSHFTYCKVASFVDSTDGVRYYQAFFYPLSTPAFGASRNTGVGIFTKTRFFYKDTFPSVVGGKLVSLTSSTDYTLDPATGRVLKAELSDVDASGKVLNHYICEQNDATS